MDDEIEFMLQILVLQLCKIVYLNLMHKFGLKHSSYEWTK